MAKFETGQKIVITNDVVDIYGNVATHGEIVGESIRFPGKWRVRAFFKGSQSDYFTLTENDFLPAQPAVPAADAEDDSGYTELIDTLDGRIKALERENAQLRDCISEILGEVAIAKEVPDKVYTLLRKIAQLATAQPDADDVGE